MNILVSKHAVKRYKERVINKKSSDGKKCVEQIKNSIRKADKIKHLNRKNENFHSFQTMCMYMTPQFDAVVGKQGGTLYVVTILEKDKGDKNDRKGMPPFQGLS